AAATTSLANPSSISTSGTYYIKLTSTQGCLVIKPVTVTINALPKLVITNPQPTCDQPVDLTSTAITAGSDVGTFSYFSDAAATTSLANPSSVTASGTYYIKLTNAQGCSVIKPVTVTILDLPKLVITNPSATCDQPINLTNPAITAGSDAGTLSYFSDAAVKTPLANPSSITTSGTYYIQLTSAQGCSVIKPVTVTINPLPKLVITNPTATCDQPVDLTNPAITAGSDLGSLSYFSDAVATMPLTNPSAITASGTYYIQLTSAQGCSVIKPVTVTINALPKLVITNPPATCDQPVDLTNATITAGSDAGTLSYFSDPAATTSLANPSALTASGTYYIKLTSVQGCLVIKPVCVSINLLPEAQFDFSGACGSSVIKFKNLTKSSTGAYKWDFGTGETSNEVEPVYDFKQEGEYTVKLTLTANGCSTSIVKKLIVGTKPKAGIEINSSLPYCTMDEIVFRDGSVSATPVSTRSWKVLDEAGAIIINKTDNNPVFVFTPPESSMAKRYQIKLTIYTTLGCIDSTAGYFTAMPKPKISLSIPDTVCQNAPPVILTPGEMIQGNYTFRGPGVKDGLFFPEVAGQGTHTIECVFTNEVGCSQKIKHEITVNGPPSVDNRVFEVPEGHSIRFDMELSSTVESEHTYRWYPEDGLDDPSSLTPIFNAQENKAYNLVITNEAGCSCEANVLVNVLPDIEVPNAISPNGDGKNDYWEIKNIEKYPAAMIYVYNRYGDKIFSSQGSAQTWDGTANGKKLPNATYYYVIQPNKKGIKPKVGDITIIY
ncbi:hypothetical protein C3K47_12010, partial [Solitalea longa]